MCGAQACSLSTQEPGPLTARLWPCVDNAGKVKNDACAFTSVAGAVAWSVLEAFSQFTDKHSEFSNLSNYFYLPSSPGLGSTVLMFINIPEYRKMFHSLSGRNPMLSVLTLLSALCCMIVVQSKKEKQSLC